LLSSISRTAIDAFVFNQSNILNGDQIERLMFDFFESLLNPKVINNIFE
jgi:hypothetical protein